jgi:hypothetical protein
MDISILTGGPKEKPQHITGSGVFSFMRDKVKMYTFGVPLMFKNNLPCCSTVANICGIQ